MLNFNIHAENKNLFFLKALSKKLSARNIENNIINNKHNKSILNIKIVGNCEPACKLAFFEILTDTILVEYKLNFLIKNLSFSGLNTKYKKVLTKALCFFDRNIDQQLIYKELKDVKNALFFESFIKFRLQGLEARWNELVRLVNSNSAYFLNSETFIDFLKFLVDSIDYNLDYLTINFTQNYYILNYKNKKEKVLRVEDNISLVLKVITLSPEKIIIVVGKYSSGDELNLLTKLFEERMEFIKEGKNMKEKNTYSTKSSKQSIYKK